MSKPYVCYRDFFLVLKILSKSVTVQPFWRLDLKNFSSQTTVKEHFDKNVNFPQNKTSMLIFCEVDQTENRNSTDYSQVFVQSLVLTFIPQEVTAAERVESHIQLCT